MSRSANQIYKTISMLDFFTETSTDLTFDYVVPTRRTR